MMFKNIFKGANNEIKASNELKNTTLDKIYDNPKRISFKRKTPWIQTAALVAFWAFLVALVLPLNQVLKNHNSNTEGSNNKNVAYALSAPKYPSKISYNDYDTRNRRFSEINSSFANSISSFSFNSASKILTGNDKTKNDLYSPISLYMALSMLAETSAGNTQEEILNTLGVDNIELLRSETPKLFLNLFTDNEIGKLTLANSIWLSNDFDFKKEALDNLAKDYYAHSFSVDFGTKAADSRISKWIKEFTGGKLGASEDVKTSKDQIMMLLNTIYFYDEWSTKFDPSKTKEEDFHLADGSTIKNDFMNMDRISNSFIKSDKYTSSSLSFKNQNSMTFILPEEGVSPYDIINDPKALSEAIDFNNSPNKAYGEVTFKIPKFNFDSKLDLNAAVKELGINEIFDETIADFSPLADVNGIYVSDVKQEATISIDENGCEAAAFTQIDIYGSAMPQGHADMILDRPFIFVITGFNNTPLFVGVINNPAN